MLPALYRSAASLYRFFAAFSGSVLWRDARAASALSSMPSAL